MKLEERQERFEKNTKELMDDGYTVKDESFTYFRANIIAFVIGMPLMLFMMAFAAKCGLDKGFLVFCYKVSKEYWRLLALIGSMIGYAAITSVIHEGIHAICFMAFGKTGRYGITFGFKKSALAPWCSYSEKLSLLGDFIATIAPTIILGVLPYVIGILLKSNLLVAAGILGVAGGCGDMASITRILKYFRKKDVKVLDSPDYVGCRVFYK